MTHQPTQTARPADQRTLFGLPDAEHLRDDLHAVYDCEIDPYDEKDDPEVVWTIEEWTCGPVRFDANRAADLAYYAGEMLCDDADFDEDGADDTDRASRDPEVVAAFQTALDLLCSKVRYRMADEKVAEHSVTHDANGEALLNGEPMFPHRQAAS